MAQAAKFLFDRDFETPVVATEPPEVVRERELREEFKRELETAREEEYRRGLADGQTQARQALEANIEKSLADIAASTGKLLTKVEAECSALRSEAVQIAMAAADCLASELVQRHPTALLETLFTECLEHLGDTPHVAVRVNDGHAEQVQEKLNAAAVQQGFAGKIIVLGDPETAKGDCRIEWADGGISRDFESLRLAVAEIVRRHLSARGNMHAANGSAAIAAAIPPETKAPAEAAPILTNGSGDIS